MTLQLQNQKFIKPVHEIHSVEIVTSGMYLPEQIVKSDHLMEEFDSYNRYGIPVDSISSKVGIVERRVAASNQMPSTLAINAATQAIDRSGIKSVDKIVFCGIMKDQAEPATAHTINHKMKLNAKDCYDITDACFGFIRGLQDCIRSIQLGEVETALVVTGETPSKGIKDFIRQLSHGVDIKTAKEIIGFLTAGDAGGAIILRRGDPSCSTGFGSFRTVSKSELWDKCCYHVDDKGNYRGQMKMGQLTAHGRRLGQKLVDSIKNDPSWFEPDHMLSHNTGDGSFDCLIDFGLAPREKWFKTYSSLGNLMSATFPVNFHLQDENKAFTSGDTIGGLFNGSGLIFGYFQYQY